MRISDRSSDVCSSDLQHQQFGTTDPLRAALAVVPGQHQRHEEPQHQRQGDAALQALRPPELLGDDIHALQECERARSIGQRRSEEHTSELQSLMRISYAVFCLKKKNQPQTTYNTY